uniref:T-complex 11 n=1 Tax=Salvator merianae TaxID=96440 RepID=A0A8D0DJE8_SALMN
SCLFRNKMPNLKGSSSDSNDSENRNCNSKKGRDPEDNHSGDIPNLCPPNIPPSDPPQILSVSELMETANEVSKMTIAHEIVINQDFKFQELNFSPNSLESRVKETLHKAFWDSLREQLTKMPPDYTHAIKLLQEIKETLLSLLLPRQTHLRSQIEEALDMDLIKQEAEHGALDIPFLATYILGMMAMLCAPVRDEEIQTLRLVTDPVHLLRWIFRVLNLMKMDMVNFTIQTLRPHLQEHSVQYERKKFQELLNKLPCSLTCTTEWLRNAAAEVSASGLLPTAVLNQAYMDLLHWEPGKAYPETMLMDKARLDALQEEVHQITIIAAVLLVSSSTCGNGVFNSLGCGERLKQIMKALLDGLPDARLKDTLLDISNQVHQEVNKILLQLQCPALSPDKVALLKGQLKSLAEKDNAVRILIEQRIQAFLRHCLTPVGQNPKVLPQGLVPVQEELLKVGQKFGSLTNHNRQVFGPYYSTILRKLLLPEGQSELGTGSC